MPLTSTTLKPLIAAAIILTSTVLQVATTSLVSADTTTVTPTLDTYVASDKPTSSYPNAAGVWIAPDKMALMRFTVTLPDGAVATGAQLKLKTGALYGTPVAANIYKVSSTWKNTSTYSTTTTDRGLCSGTPLASAIPKVGQISTFDLPASVIENNMVNICIAHSASSGSARFESMETADKPQLSIDYTTGTQPPAPETPSTIMQIQDMNITDSSGWVVSTKNAGIRWTHEDRTNQSSTLWAIRDDGLTVATMNLTGSGLTHIDTEDAATATINGTPYVYLSDAGGNLDKRTNIYIHRFVEPTLDSTIIKQAVTAEAQSWTFTYPAADLKAARTAGPDSESLLVNPSTGQMYVIVKTRTGLTTTTMGIYAAPLEASAQPGTYQLTKVASTLYQTTGAAWSADGTRVALRTYDKVYVYSVSSGGLATALTTPPLELTPPTMAQSEGISFSADGEAVELSTEVHTTNGKANIVRMPLPTAYYVAPIVYAP
jgi:hypothetical protein